MAARKRKEQIKSQQTVLLVNSTRFSQYLRTKSQFLDPAEIFMMGFINYIIKVKNFITVIDFFNCEMLEMIIGVLILNSKIKMFGIIVISIDIFIQNFTIRMFVYPFVCLLSHKS